MITNRILDRIRSGEKALGLSMNDPSEELVEMAGRMGLDFVSFDGQHAPLTPERVGTLCRIADGYGLTPAMRVPDHEESTILSYLDRGIRQIIVPFLETKAQAEALVRHTFYAPIGLRSSASARMVMFQGKEDRRSMYQAVNAAMLLVPQLETATALKNLDEILTVDGIDFFTGGFEDLAQTMGYPGEPSHPEVLAAWNKAVEKIHAAGKHLYNDYIETIDVFGLVHGSARDLMTRHGRAPGLG